MRKVIFFLVTVVIFLNEVFAQKFDLVNELQRDVFGHFEIIDANKERVLYLDFSRKKSSMFKLDIESNKVSSIEFLISKKDMEHIGKPYLFDNMPHMVFKYENKEAGLYEVHLMSFNSEGEIVKDKKLYSTKNEEVFGEVRISQPKNELFLCIYAGKSISVYDRSGQKLYAIKTSYTSILDLNIFDDGVVSVSGLANKQFVITNYESGETISATPIFVEIGDLEPYDFQLDVDVDHVCFALLSGERRGWDVFCRQLDYFKIEKRTGEIITNKTVSLVNEARRRKGVFLSLKEMTLGNGKTVILTTQRYSITVNGSTSEVAEDFILFIISDNGEEEHRRFERSALSVKIPDADFALEPHVFLDGSDIWLIYNKYTGGRVLYLKYKMSIERLDLSLNTIDKKIFDSDKFKGLIDFSRIQEIEDGEYILNGWAYPQFLGKKPFIGTYKFSF